jgi:hypothetical protein
MEVDPGNDYVIQKDFHSSQQAIGCMFYYRAQWILLLFDKLYKKCVKNSPSQEKLWEIGMKANMQHRTEHEWHIQVISHFLENESIIKECIPPTIYKVHNDAKELYDRFIVECHKYRSVYVRYCESKELRPAAVRAS